MEERNRNPEIILKKIEKEEKREQRGRLKIFFGYAAGVGKTYAMLSCAKKELESGVDIVAGYIEPHARPETMKLMEGLEVLPPKVMYINKISCKELDIDAVLKRNPQIVLIDEMAHTNADGCRHPKRYQDILELLNAGIDVYTTINVQHIESVQDTVAGITGVQVRERIPDSVFDMASQVEMIDIPPEELILRLKEGKVYKSERVGQALGNFFTIENLTALREIALRRMADWVNQEQDGLAVVGEGGNATEHIMMCLSSSPSNAKVIRQAARMAKAFHGKLTAFYVETPEYAQMEQEDVFRLQENRKLAEKFGAKIVISFGTDIVEQIAEYAKVARVTKIVLGRSYTRRSFFSVKESYSERLTKLVPNLEIFLIPDSYEKKYKKRKIRWEEKFSVSDFGISILILLTATGIATLFDYLGFGDTNLIMIYVLGVLFTAYLSKYRVAGVCYGVVSILIYSFLFTEPRMRFHIKDSGFIITFGVMFTAEVMISSLVRKLKGSARESAKKAYRTGILLDTSQILQQKKNAKEIGQSTAEQIGKLLNRNVCCFLGNPLEEKQPLIYEAKQEKMELTEQELAVAEWSYKNNKCAGATTSTLPGAKNLYLTIRNGEKLFGLVGIDLKGKVLSGFEESMMLAILNESALALEKEEGMRKEREMAVKLEQEHLRSNLLRTISHDFRTPLTSIYGNADMLLSQSEQMETAQKKAIYSDIYDDAGWLMNLVENLLSVTRIENGSMKLDLQPEIIDDVITEALKHISKNAQEHHIHYRAAEEILVADMDAKLIMQVVINLVNNAIKYTPKGSEIIVEVLQKKKKVQIAVKDDGFGIEEDKKEKVFTMFYTQQNMVADGRRGMGLGLSLCKSIVEAHGGKIWVSDNRPKGTVFTFELQLKEMKGA